MASHRRLFAAVVAALGIAGCALPQSVAPSRYGRVLQAGQTVIPGEVVVTFEPGAALPRDFMKTGPGTGIYRLRAGETIAGAIAALEAQPGISGAGANVVYRAAAEPPNDPLFSRQWYHETIGSVRAWPRAQGGTPVTVAVLDSGIDAGHPEFAGRVLGGQSFVPGTAGPADDYGHGTHVAGLVGALTHNGVGIAGSAPDVRILPIKVLDHQGLGSLDGVIAGIKAARSAGARVINMSLASQVSSSLQDKVIDECVRAGIVVVAAAGNESSDTPQFPAGSPGVMAVGATDARDSRADFSNGGPHVRVVAPGVEIVSTHPRSMGSYVFKNGTSMAAPIVSGVVAAMLAAKPALTTNEVVKILYQTGAPAKGFDQARRIDFAGAMAAVAPAPPVAAPAPTSAPVATPAPPAPSPTATPRQDGQLPAWGLVGMDGETAGTEPEPGQSPPPEGLKAWGLVGLDGSEATPAPESTPTPATEPPPKAWGLVPME